MKKNKITIFNQELEEIVNKGDFLKIKETLKEDNCGLNNKDNYGRTVIYDAIVHGYSDIVEELCEAKADVNNSDDNGKTPLHFASIHNRFDIAKILLQYGADINIKDKNGNTPIFDAVFNYKGNPSLILLLKDNGADYLTPNKHGVSPKRLSEIIANFDVSILFNESGLQ